MSRDPHGPRSRDRAAHRSEAGTSTLEVAGLAPLVLLVAFALLHAGFALYGVTAAQTAARQAARADSLGQDPASAAQAALPGWLDSRVTTFGPGHGVRVLVDLPDLVPGVDLTVSRQAVMP